MRKKSVHLKYVGPVRLCNIETSSAHLTVVQRFMKTNDFLHTWSTTSKNIQLNLQQHRVGPKPMELSGADK